VGDGNTWPNHKNRECGAGNGNPAGHVVYCNSLMFLVDFAVFDIEEVRLSRIFGRIRRSFIGTEYTKVVMSTIPLTLLQYRRM
jgi:hypothetical protein